MDEHDALAQEIRDLAYDISQSDDAGTAEENWWRAEEEVLRREIAARVVLEIGRDDGWSELDDEEHAALEAVHERSALS
jgi:hypothetical protein